MEGQSSHASINPNSSANTSSDAGTGLKCTSGDMAWEWGVWKDPTKKGNIWCTLCDKKMSEGITRLKRHLTHTKGDVTSCPKVTTEITKRVLASMQEKDKVTNEKKRRNSEILRSSNMRDLSEDEDVDDEVQVKRKESKKRKSVGASNVRGPLDSILKNDHGKTNQSTLDKNNPIK
ncbi:zinc finger protein [Artemisia annua]|uniref:Zinc finger protein n=1 Tax=Artemisia annua TaxID=35608 RepID=A0A2U1Q8R5_ARTAN|nr:zinc finger protein [Artemisia annua]